MGECEESWRQYVRADLTKLLSPEWGDASSSEQLRAVPSSSYPAPNPFEQGNCPCTGLFKLSTNLYPRRGLFLVSLVRAKQTVRLNDRHDLIMTNVHTVSSGSGPLWLIWKVDLLRQMGTVFDLLTGGHLPETGPSLVNTRTGHKY